MKLVSVHHTPTDTRGEVLVTFANDDGSLRNVLLRKDTDFAVANTHLDALEQVLVQAERAKADAKAQFAKVAEDAARKQMAFDDEAAKPKQPDAAAASVVASS